MVKDSYERLSAYLRWADNLILTASQDFLEEDERLRFWLHHIVNAQEIWLDRIAGHSPRISPREVGEDANLADRYEISHNRMAQLAKSLMNGQGGEVITYQNSKGEKFQSLTEDIFLHIINHSTHHRAQIASRIRELGAKPPPTDYIFFMRQ